VEKLAVHALDNPVKIVCGDVGESNEDVSQSVYVLPDAQAKFNWLSSRIVELCSMGKVLIFVTKKLDAEEIAKKLKLRDVNLVLLHGDMLQNERNEQITAFRSKIPVMVATDVAARGLDIPEIRNVINYDVARDIDTHVHRIGRTGRAGQKGFAHTLITEGDKEFAGHLVRNLEAAGQEVPQPLVQVAQKSSWFKQQKDKGGATGGPVKQRPGLGFTPKERPGFGNPVNPTTSLGFSSAPSVTKAVNRAKSLANTGGNTGLNRLDMMKSAFKSSFQHTFQKASTDDSSEWRNKSVAPPPQAASDGTSADEVSFGRKKRSRWD
jgi:ATP-dependent RNA helicase DDX42